MNNETPSYRKIMKATSIFGGVQFLNIIISIIRSKIIAIFLGSAGIGIAGLLNSSLNLVGGITNFGLSTSAVRDVSAANTNDDKKKIDTVISVLRRLVWFTGLLGSMIILIFSHWLSKITFGNTDFTFSFALVSITLLFNQLSIGQLVILQGLQKLKHLAKASLFGNLIGLIISLPLYYFFKIEAIAPTLIITSLISFFTSWFFASKVKVTKIKLSLKQTFAEGGHMLKMGFMISLSGLLVTSASYILQIFINNRGGVEQVGLFTAGFSIINTYVGLIFTAMATDYFPRLSSVANSNEMCKKSINQQAEISLIILGPIVLIFLVFIKLVIIILYSHKFILIEDMVLWLALAIFFKASAWSIGFILLAKGDSKIFFWNDFLGNGYMLLLDITGYYFWGLTGLGISFFIGYLLFLIQVLILTKIRYNFYFDRSFIKIFIIQFSLALSCFLLVKFIDKPYSYFFGTILILISIFHSYVELDKRLGLKVIISNFLNRDK